MLERLVVKDITELLTGFPAVALVGPRQVGKTTLVKTLENQLSKELIYVDLENPRDEGKLSDPVLFFENNQDKCVVLDEIQRRKDLFPILRSMIDQYREPARFILLGSASPELIRDSSESLAGRIYYQEITPFHLMELGEAADEKRLLLRGGFPNAYLAKTDNMSWLWREGFIQTYVERDLPLLGLPLSPIEARRLLRMLSILQGQLLNHQSLAKSMGVSAPTVKRYIQFLQHAFLIDLLEPFSGNSTKRITKSPKIYVRDTGILNYLLGIKDYNDFLAHPNAGGIWEGFVIQQIRSVLKSDCDRCFYRTSHGAEIDLVLTFPNQKRIGVEIKLSASPSLTRGNYEVMNDLNLETLYVIIPTHERYSLKENIVVMGIRTFLEIVSAG